MKIIIERLLHTLFSDLQSILSFFSFNQSLSNIIIIYLPYIVLIITSIIKYKKLKKGYANSFFINNMLLIIYIALNIVFDLSADLEYSIYFYADNKYSKTMTPFMNPFVYIYNSYLLLPTFILICEYIIRKKLKRK